MEIIFVTLPRYLDFVCILIKKIGYRVYYLNLSQFSNSDEETKKQRVIRLKNQGIAPLALADLPRFQGFSEMHSDPDMKIFKRTLEIAPMSLLEGLKDLFPDITNIEKKMQIAVHSEVALQYMYVSGKINIWARANREIKYLLIDFRLKGLLNPKMAPNVWQVVLPLDIVEKGFNTFITFFYRVLHSLWIKLSFKDKARKQDDSCKNNVTPSKVAYVTHQGLKYGDIFQKDLFYSTQKESELHPERLLHIDYSNWASPSNKLKWVCLGNHRQSWWSNIKAAFVAFSKGILHVRQVQHILGLFILVRFYVIFRSFSTKLEAYTDLKLALIDYDILCPKELVLAFESKGIKTVATQERFLSAFAKLFATMILNTYLCNSKFVIGWMRKSPIICVDRYIPVGQYRADKLLEAPNLTPPNILEAPIAKGLKVITALGYHTPREWQKSQVDLLTNWRSHQQFLDDMIQLSKDISDVFIILRYKEVDWMSLPIFSETLQKINSSENMTISSDYSKDFVSYDLCAHSDLVIAKFTSLADECLSVGIPVLFHEYTHNTERIIADAFDYTPARIMCFNYEELKERAQIILSGTPNAMTEDYEYLKKVVYGGLGDGRVKERIHAHIEEMLSDL